MNTGLTRKHTAMTQDHDVIVTRTAITAARAAGEAIRRAFVAAEHGDLPATEEKAGHADVVTAIDREAESIISAIIFRNMPDSRILGEENGWQGTGGDIVWYVDPIDGTSNFATGLPLFCVSIAAYTGDGRAVCGVIFDPMRDELFVASAGQLTLNGTPVTGRTRTTRDRDAELLTNLPREGARPSANELDHLAGLLQDFRAVRRLGSAALHLAYVAVGRATVAFDEGCYPWDMAAGLLLVKAGGGQIVAFGEGDQRLDADTIDPAVIRRLVVATPGFEMETSCLLADENRDLRNRHYN